MRRGARIGIIGESGAGKTTLIRAITGFLPTDRFGVQGHILIDGTDVTELPPRERRRAISAAISVIWQDSISALNPCRRVGVQVADTLRLHADITRRQARAEAVGWIDRVGIARPAEVFNCYPHQLSGGMRQRISLALGLCGGQPVVIADEPTTALDMVRQQECVGLIDRLCREDATTLIFVSHDLALTAQVCDELIVLQAGRVLESGATTGILSSPTDPLIADLVARARRLRPPRRTT